MTPDQKRDAWVRFAAEAPVEFYATVAGYNERSPAQNAAIHADELLSETEQREREGRFGVEGPVENSKEWWAEKEALEKRADRAEAEVERLRADLKAHRTTAEHEAYQAGVKEGRAKAESLLKEALAQLRDAAVLYTPKSIGREDIDNLLARARQEGFSDGKD